MKKYYADLVYNFYKDIEEKIFPDSVLLDMKRSIQLDSYSCGAQCVYMILEYYKIPKTLDEILKGLNTSKKDGTDTEPILNYLRINGLKISINIRSKLFNIHSALDKLNPILISVDYGEHWVVIYGYNKDGMFILDPARNVIQNFWDMKKFMSRWDDTWIAVIKRD
ncbi:MAG: cysteine peptidase family C39 domain-containing protein [Ignavibacteriaceae bacterium]